MLVAKSKTSGTGGASVYAVEAELRNQSNEGPVYLSGLAVRDPGAPSRQSDVHSGNRRQGRNLAVWHTFSARLLPVDKLC